MADYTHPVTGMKSCMPPDPHTRIPSFTPPKEACHAHCHVFGPQQVFSYHPNATYHPPDSPKKALAALHQTLGIARAAIFQASCHGPDNRAMMDALATSPQTYRSVCISNDSFSDKDFADLDAGGVHQPAFQILRQFIERDNWWVKICGSERISAAGPPFYDAVPYAQELVEIAPDRILWGTDWPHPNIKKHMPNDGDLLDLVPLLARDTALQKKILVDNPARLYGFDGASQ